MRNILNVEGLETKQLIQVLNQYLHFVQTGLKVINHQLDVRAKIKWLLLYKTQCTEFSHSGRFVLLFILHISTISITSM